MSSDAIPTAGLGLVWSAVTASPYLLFVLLVSRDRAFVTRPSTPRALGCASGVVLMAAGATVALGH